MLLLLLQVLQVWRHLHLLWVRRLWLAHARPWRQPRGCLLPVLLLPSLGLLGSCLL